MIDFGAQPLVVPESLSDVPLSDVPLSDVPLSDVPLSDVPVSDVVSLVPVSVPEVPESSAGPDSFVDIGPMSRHGIGIVVEPEPEPEPASVVELSPGPKHTPAKLRRDPYLLGDHADELRRFDP